MQILLAPEAFKGKKKYTGIECWLKWPIKLFVTSNKHVISHQFTLFEICSLTSKRNSSFASSFSTAFWLLSVSCFSWWCNIRDMRYRDNKKFHLKDLNWIFKHKSETINTQNTRAKVKHAAGKYLQGVEPGELSCFLCVLQHVDAECKGDASWALPTIETSVLVQTPEWRPWIFPQM